MEPQLPETVAGYRVEGALDDGRLGPVYEVVAGDDGDHLAVELIRGTEKFAIRWAGVDSAQRATEHLSNELRLLTHLRHPNVVAVHEVGFSSDPPGVFVATGLVGGVSLTEFFADADRRAIVDVLVQLARALDHVHALGFVHGTIDPARVMVVDDGGRPRPKLPDVGAALVARVVRGDDGPAAAVAPEQASGAPADRRSDIYALASAVQAALLGVRAPDPAGKKVGAWQAAAEELLDRAGPVVADAVRRMLDPDPNARPGTVRSIVYELLRREAPEGLEGQDEEEERKELARILLERIPFIDRGEHLEALLDRANVGLGRDGIDERPIRTILIEGPRGLGATMLMEEFRRELRLRGRSFYEVGAWGEQQGTGAFTTTIVQLASTTSSDIERKFADLIGTAREREPAAVEPQRISDFFVACANERPYVLYLADLARSAELGRQVFDQLARAIAHFRTPMLLCVTAEPHAKLNRVTVQLRRDEIVEARTLRPFTKDDISQLVHGIFGDSDVIRPLTDLLDELTGGHPIGLRETLRLLIEESILAREGNDWILHESRPAAGNLHEQLAARTEARIDGIGVAAWELTATLHVIGGPIEERVLAELAELRRDRFTRMLERLEVEGLITRTAGGESDEIGLAHRSVHEAVQRRYETSLDETRMDLAGRIQELGTEDPRLLYLRGKLLDDGSTGLENVDTVESIAEGLCKSGQATLGSSLLDRVISRRRSHGGLDGASRLLATIVTLLKQAGGAMEDPEEESAHYEAGVLLAQLLGDHWAEATLWLGLADRFAGSTGEHTTRALRRLEKAAEAAKAARDRILELRIANRRAEVLVTIGQLEQSLTQSAEAMKILEMDDPPDVDVCAITGVRIRCLTFAGEFERAHELHDTIGKEVAKRVPVVQRQSYLSGVALLASSTDPTTAIEELLVAVKELREARALRLLRIPLHNLGDVYLRSGQLEDAAGCFRETLGLARLQGNEFDIHLNAGFLGYTLARLGKVEEGAQMLAEATEGMRTLVGEHFGYHQMRLLSAEVMHMRGDSNRARQRLEEIAAEFAAGSLKSLASWAQDALARIEADVDTVRSQSRKVRKEREDRKRR